MCVWEGGRERENTTNYAQDIFIWSCSVQSCYYLFTNKIVI